MRAFVVLCLAIIAFGGGVFAGMAQGYQNALRDVCESGGNVWVQQVGCLSELPTVSLTD